MFLLFTIWFIVSIILIKFGNRIDVLTSHIGRRELKEGLVKGVLSNCRLKRRKPTQPQDLPMCIPVDKCLISNPPFTKPPFTSTLIDSCVLLFSSSRRGHGEIVTCARAGRQMGKEMGKTSLICSCFSKDLFSVLCMCMYVRMYVCMYECMYRICGSLDPHHRDSSRGV